MPVLSDSEAFLDHVLDRFFADQSAMVPDNFDESRFGAEETATAYEWVHKEALCALIRNPESFFKVYALWGDEVSRSLYIDLLRYRLSGHRHVRLPTNDESYQSLRRKEYEHPCAPSPLQPYAADGQLMNHYELIFEDQKIVFDGLTLFWPFYTRQYFFARDGVEVRVRPGDHVIDAGACLGDTALALGAAAGPGGAVHLFELLDPHLHICAQNLAQNKNLCAFTLHPVGLSDHVNAGLGVALPTQTSPGFSIEGRGNDFPTETLDHLYETGKIERVDFIKMDIEGSELAALRGGEGVLRRFKPRLAISLYHKLEDLTEIPLYLDSLGLGYRFYLDHYTIHLGESVLYAHADI